MCEHHTPSVRTQSLHDYRYKKSTCFQHWLNYWCLYLKYKCASLITLLLCTQSFQYSYFWVIKYLFLWFVEFCMCVYVTWDWLNFILLQCAVAIEGRPGSQPAFTHAQLSRWGSPGIACIPGMRSHVFALWKDLHRSIWNVLTTSDSTYLLSSESLCVCHILSLPWSTSFNSIYCTWLICS